MLWREKSPAAEHFQHFWTSVIGPVFRLLNNNRNLSHTPGPQPTQGSGLIRQPRTDTDQYWSLGPQPTKGPHTLLGQTKVNPTSTGPPSHRAASSPLSTVSTKTDCDQGRPLSDLTSCPLSTRRFRPQSGRGPQPLKGWAFAPSQPPLRAWHLASHTRRKSLGSHSW